MPAESKQKFGDYWKNITAIIHAQVDLKHLSHSLGVSSSKNAMNWATYEGMQFDNTALTANTVGTSYPMTNNTIGGRLSFGLYDQGYLEKQPLCLEMER